MEHTDQVELSDNQRAVLDVIAEATIPLDAKAISKRAPQIERRFVTSALAALTKAKLVDRTDTAGGYIYEISEAGQGYFTDRAKDASARRLCNSLNPEQAEWLEAAVENAEPFFDQQTVYGPAGRVELEKRRPTEQLLVEAFAEQGSIDRLIAAANHEPLQRPDDLDGHLADLERMIEGFTPRFPDVARMLCKVRQYLDTAYPKSESPCASE